LFAELNMIEMWADRRVGQRRGGINGTFGSARSAIAPYLCFSIKSAN
jgi:hypothetical protein